MRRLNGGVPTTIGRRQFLLGAQGVALAVPFLPSLVRSGSAQQLSKKKFISYHITNGFFGHQWYPGDAATAGPNGLKLVEPNAREMALSDIAGPISPLLDARFDPFRSKMVLMRHIDRLDRSDHQAGNGLFGWANYKDAPASDFLGRAPSIDKLIAKHAFGGAEQPLNLSIRWSQSGASCSVSPTPQGGLVFEAGLYPDQAYQKLFANFTVDVDTAARRRAYKQNIVDRVLPHYRAVRDNARLAAADLNILDQHIEHMQTLHTRLSLGGAACTPPGNPGGWTGKPEQVNSGAQAQIDIAVAALRCGLTPIVNLYLDPDTLMTEPLHGVVGGHHGASHATGPGAVLSIFNAHVWHMRYLVDLLTKLEATVDPTDGKTLLDNSLVFVHNEIGNQAGRSGNQPGDLDANHLGIDVQTLFIGSCGGALRTGTFLDLRTDFERNRWTRYIGTAYNRVLVSCMLAMGLVPANWEVNGQPGYGDMRGGLYDQTPPSKVAIGDMRAYLPRIKAP